LPKHNELCIMYVPCNVENPKKGKTSTTPRQERRRQPQDRKAVDNPKTGKTTLYNRGLVLFLQSFYFFKDFVLLGLDCDLLVC
jgi:hypothetical protein